MDDDKGNLFKMMVASFKLSKNQFRFIILELEGHQLSQGQWSTGHRPLNKCHLDKKISWKMSACQLSPKQMSTGQISPEEMSPDQISPEHMSPGLISPGQIPSKNLFGL